MDKVNLLAKDDFPMSTDALNVMQEMTLLASKLALLGGRNYILQGCAEDNNGNVSNGLIIVDGEILPFEGGIKKDKIEIETTKKTLDFDEELYPEAYILRKVVFSDAGTHNWSDFKRVLSNGELQAIIADIKGDAPGTVKMWAGDTSKIPDEYMLCDGTPLLKSKYPELFNNIGILHGSESGDSFNLPDMRDRFIVGYNNQVGDYNVIGKKGGEKDITLSVPQLPPHKHNFRGVYYDTNTWDGGGGAHGGYVVYYEENAATRETGEGKPIENRPPYFVLAYIIKVK